jgi:hypothetical protein
MRSVPMQGVGGAGESDMTGLRRSTSARSSDSALPTLPDPDVTAPAPAQSAARLQHWMDAPLLAAERAGTWFGRLQQHNLQAANLWWETLTLAALEADHAEGLGHLLAVPTRLFDRQAHLTLQCCADNLQDFMDTEARWLRQAQADWLALGRTWSTA